MTNNESGAESTFTTFIPGVNMTAAKELPCPYSMKIVRMDYGESSNDNPFIPIEKDSTGTAAVIWTESNPNENIVWGFFGDGKPNEFRIFAQFEYKNDLGNNVPVKVKVEAFTEDLGLVSNASVVKFGESENTICLAYGNGKTEAMPFTFHSYCIDGHVKHDIVFQWMYENSDHKWIEMDNIRIAVYFIPVLYIEPVLQEKTIESQRAESQLFPYPLNPFPLTNDQVIFPTMEFKLTDEQSRVTISDIVINWLIDEHDKSTKNKRGEETSEWDEINNRCMNGIVDLTRFGINVGVDWLVGNMAKGFLGIVYRDIEYNDISPEHKHVMEMGSQNLFKIFENLILGNKPLAGTTQLYNGELSQIALENLKNDMDRLYERIYSYDKQPVWTASIWLRFSVGKNGISDKEFTVGFKAQPLFGFFPWNFSWTKKFL